MKGRWEPCAQYISNKRPSRFVILSETKDLARRTEILRFTQDDTPETASFDWQHVLFEMYWAPGPHPSPHPPLVPTERRGRKRPDGRDYPLRLEKFIRLFYSIVIKSLGKLCALLRGQIRTLRDGLPHLLFCCPLLFF